MSPPLQPRPMQRPVQHDAELYYKPALCNFPGLTVHTSVKTIKYDFALCDRWSAMKTNYPTMSKDSVLHNVAQYTKQTSNVVRDYHKLNVPPYAIFTYLCDVHLRRTFTPIRQTLPTIRPCRYTLGAAIHKRFGQLSGYATLSRLWRTSPLATLLTSHIVITHMHCTILLTYIVMVILCECASPAIIVFFTALRHNTVQLHRRFF